MTNCMTDSRYALRPEAGPVQLDSLNRSQREALKAIVAALTQAVEDAARSSGSSPSADVDHAVEADRVSRLFFVSGQPGSGKSSLYVTLRALLGNDHRYDDIREQYRKEFPDISSSSLKGKTRWLEPLDLEVAVDDGENLLAAVLVRISEAIDHSSLSASNACRDALEQLEELANDIGIAWDGNLKARAGHLDPDSYSQETMRAQRTRLKTNSRLRSALDTLLKNECYALSGEQLFVLPIDDFYLKPKASLELLRLLRMISVPRLFFLIMGDIKTVEALFLEKALFDWTAVAGSQVFATRPRRAKQEVLARVREMKARYLRKLIPEGQRAIINWTEWDEALAFKPPAEKDSDNVPQLCQLLSGVRISWRDEPDGCDHNLLDYLVSPSLKSADCHEARRDCRLSSRGKQRLKEQRESLEAYSGLQVLDATPREVLDLWMQLQQRWPNCEDVDKRDPEYLRMVVECAVSAVEEQDFLTEEDQEILRFAFPTSTRDDLQFDTARLRLQQKFSPWRTSIAGDVLVRPHLLDWRLGPNPQEAKWQNGENGPSDENERWHLPPRLAAWVILLHDLAWQWNYDSVLENLVRRLLREIRDSSIGISAARDLDKARSGWAWHEDRGHWVHFPLPEVDTFRELDRFLAVWSRELPEELVESVKSESREAVAQDQQWKRRVARGWAKAAWIVKQDSELRYHAYVSPEPDVNDGHREQREAYAAVLSGWNDDEDSKANEFIEKLFSDHRALRRWAAGSNE